MSAKVNTKRKRKSQAGCSQMIHRLKDAGEKKAIAYEKVAKRYGFGEPQDGVPIWFGRIWDGTDKATRTPAKKGKK